MAKPRVYTTTAFVLKYRNYGESDRFITFLSRELGQVQGFAKGVRRSTSKLTGHLELFHNVRVSFAVGKNIDVITEVEIVKTADKINDSLSILSCALNITELAINLSAEGPGNEAIYDLLYQALNALNGSDEDNAEKLLAYYQLNLLFISGLAPEYKEWVECRCKLSKQDHVYNATAGGIICPNCTNKQIGSLTNLSVNSIKVLRYIESTDIKSVELFPIPKPIISDVNKILNLHINHHIDRKIRSSTFFKVTD